MPENTAETCPCKRLKCPRRGQCAACIAYHEGSRYLPQCLRGKGSKGGKKRKMTGGGCTDSDVLHQN